MTTTSVEYVDDEADAVLEKPFRCAVDEFLHLLRDAIDACRRAGSSIGAVPIDAACVQVAGLDYWAQMLRTFSRAVISGVVSMVIDPSLNSRAAHS